MHYIPHLDGLRAAAVLMVLAFHARVPGAGGGFLGVDLFFVLSGYLITRLLAAEHDRRSTIDIGAFYGRRLRRLYPALLLVLAAYAMTAWWAFPTHDEVARDVAISALYLANYTHALLGIPDVLSHMWSLATEQQFYLVWPLMMAMVLKLPRRQQLVALCGLFIAVTLWRFQQLDAGATWREVYYRADTRLSGLFLGGILAVWRPNVPAGTWALGFALLACAGSQAQWREPAALGLWMTCAEIGAGTLILSADRLRLLAARPMVWLGQLSYGIYLWHYPIMRWCRMHQWSWIETVLVGTVLATAAAWVSYRTIERWFRPQTRTQGHGAAGPLTAPVDR